MTDHRRNSIRAALAACVLFMTYLAGAELGHALSFPGNIATFWPPSGIYLAALLATPTRLWPGVVLAAGCANLASDVGFHGKTTLVSLGFWGANTVEATCGALILRACCSPVLSLTRLRHALALAICSSLGACGVAAFLGATVVSLVFGTPYWTAWSIWWSSSALGVLIVAPACLCGRDSAMQNRPGSLACGEEMLAYLLLIGVAGWAVDVGGPLLAFAAFPVLLWIALRFETRGVIIGMLLLAVISIWQTAHGRAARDGLSPPIVQQNVLILQAFLGVAAVSFLATAATLSERRRAWDQLAAAEARSRHLFENMTDLIMTVSPQGQLRYVNQAWRAAMGYRPDELGSLKFSQLVPAEELPHCRTSFQRLLAGEQLEVLEFRLLSRSGQVLDVEGTCTTSREHGQIVEICACLRNVTLRKRAERSADLYRRELEHANAQLRSLSITDPLTHLYNRRFFQQKLEEEYERSRRYGTPLALLLIDVDHFKLFNDTYGHLAGDSVLCNVADLLRDAARQCDIVARYGGEEFSVLSPLTNLEDAFQLAERLRQAIAGGPWLGRSVSVSIGVACTNHGQPDPANLIHLADEALYASKQHGRNRTTALSPDRSSLTTRNWPLGVENLVTARAETRGKSAATLRPLAHC